MSNLPGTGPQPPGAPPTGPQPQPVPCVTAAELLEVRARCQPTADGTGNVILTEAALNWFKAHLMKRLAQERELQAEADDLILAYRNALAGERQHPGDEGPKE